MKQRRPETMSRKRRTFSAEFKFGAVMDLLTGEKGPAQICRERAITDKLLYRWKQEFMERAPGVFEDRRSGAAEAETEQRAAELERLVGRLALENEVLKNAASWREAHQRRNGR
jgi:transposase-like protein